MLGFLYLLLKPKTRGKTKEEKHVEILLGYKNKLDVELSSYMSDEKLLLKKKTEFLKIIADELNRNIFFDVDETKSLIQELINYKIKG